GMDNPAASSGTPRAEPPDRHAGSPPANGSAVATAPEPRRTARRPPACVTAPTRVRPSSRVARENRRKRDGPERWGWTGRGRGVAERRWQLAERKAEEQEPAAGQVENPGQCRRRMVQSQVPTGHGGLLRGV